MTPNNLGENARRDREGGIKARAKPGFWGLYEGFGAAAGESAGKVLFAGRLCSRSEQIVCLLFVQSEFCL